MKVNALKRKRAAAKLTISELAAKTKLSPTTITALENGKQVARAVTIEKLAEALGCSFDDLSELMLPNSKAA